MRHPLVIGNWKMHGSRHSVAELLGALCADAIPPGVEVAVCPVYVHLEQALALCAGSSMQVGAQDCSTKAEGAYTGEVAAGMIADFGCKWVILGHSERRANHRETDAVVAAKLGRAVTAGLQPVLCVGETREQREASEQQSVVAAQLAGALQGADTLTGLVIAYEPVWAIGTGLTATPEEAQAMHAFIRAQLAVLGVDAQTTRILYGGSVKPGNAAELFAQHDIDGALVGGAALVPEDFKAIIQAAA